MDERRRDYEYRQQGSPMDGGYGRGRRVWDPESGMYNQSPGYGRSTPAGRSYDFRDYDFDDGGSSYDGWGRGGYGQYDRGTFGRRSDEDHHHERGYGDRGWFSEDTDSGMYGSPSRVSKSGPGRRGETFAHGPHTGKGPRGYRRSDDRIREDISEALTQHGWIDATGIEVTVVDGEATLKGTVDDRSQKRMAEDVAECISGVWDVHNQLKLKQMQGNDFSRELKHDPATTAGQPASGTRAENTENNRTATPQR